MRKKLKERRGARVEWRTEEENIEIRETEQETERSFKLLHLFF